MTDESSGRYPIPPTSDIRLAEVLKALADPHRLRIVEQLADDGFHPVTAESLGLPVQKSTMSHHLKTLREAGLTETRMDGRACLIRLRRDDLESRFPGLLAALTSADALADLQRS